jgi:hypothetical protein
MKMRLHRPNPVAGKPSVSPADQYSGPTFTRISQTMRTRRPIFLVIGALLTFIGMLLGSAIAFVSGMLVVALSVPGEGPHSPTAAMVRTWQWLYKDHAHHL